MMLMLVDPLLLKQRQTPTRARKGALADDQMGKTCGGDDEPKAVPSLLWSRRRSGIVIWKGNALIVPAREEMTTGRSG